MANELCAILVKYIMFKKDWKWSYMQHACINVFTIFICLPDQVESSVVETFKKIVQEEYGKGTIRDSSIDYVQRQVSFP